MTRAHAGDHLGQKRGLPPGALVHIGERKLDEPRITILEYDETYYSCVEVKKLGDFKPTPERVTWINVDGIHEAATIEDLGRCFGLHPLVLEDVMNTGQRPKLEEYDECLFVVLKMLDVDKNTEDIMVEQISLVLGKSFVITFGERVGDVFDGVRDRLKRSLGKSRKAKADYLAYRLIDSVIDHYFVVLDRMSDFLEDVEEQIALDPTRVDSRELHTLKRETLFLRKSIHPARELLGTLARIEDSDIIQSSTMVYLRDVYDHALQVSETLESQREILASMLDVYHSALSNRMNEVMKVLSIVSTIFIPLSFVAGVYGMNFKHMPETQIPWAYPAVLCFMGIAATAMLIWLRRKRWI
jgi:magnesium transporter